MSAYGPTLDELIDRWRTFVARRPAMDAASVTELESHLRDGIDDLVARGLADDEAFLVAVKRLGAVDDVSREFAREHSDLLWKQLTTSDSAGSRHPVRLTIAIVLAIAAGVAVKVPGWIAGATGADSVAEGQSVVLLVDGVVLALAALGAYFVVRSRPPVGPVATVAAAVVVLASAITLYPWGDEGTTLILAALHLPVAVWLLLGVLYAGGRWRSETARMDLIRFTGEWVVYYALIALGGGVLAALTAGLFAAIGQNVMWFVGEWMLPCGAAGAVVIAAWLVDAKQAVIENIAPVLTRVFTPLFALLLVAFAVVGLMQGGMVDVDRNLLILFDITLVVVLGLVLYAQSARAPLTGPGWFDRLQLGLIGAAIVVDALVLIAMVGRIGTYGATANKVASLGLNALLLVNLVGAAVLLVRFLRHRSTFAPLERWQTGYLPVYLGWALVVVIVFPPVFAFG